MPVDPYYSELKNRINYYRMQNIPPPLSLLEEYHHYNRMYGRSSALLPYLDSMGKNEYFEATTPHVHVYDSHYDPLTGHHSSSEIHHEVHHDPFHHFDDFDEHGFPRHIVHSIYEHHPIYDEFGREVIYPSSPFVPGIIPPPPSPLPAMNLPPRAGKTHMFVLIKPKQLFLWNSTEIIPEFNFWNNNTIDEMHVIIDPKKKRILKKNAEFFSKYGKKFFTGRWFLVQL